MRKLQKTIPFSVLHLMLRSVGLFELRQIIGRLLEFFEELETQSSRSYNS